MSKDPTKFGSERDIVSIVYVTVACLLTVEPFRVVFECTLEAEFSTAGGEVVEVGAEDDGVGFGEFGVGAGIEAGEVAGVSVFDPDCCGVVGGVVRAFRNAHSDTWDVLVSG